LDRLREGGVDLLVVERGDGDSGSGAIEFLHRVRNAGYATPSVLIATPEPDLLTAAINEARVTRVVSAEKDLEVILDEILVAVVDGTAETPKWNLHAPVAVRWKTRLIDSSQTVSGAKGQRGSCRTSSSRSAMPTVSRKLRAGAWRGW
jgi:hypothetical protein